MQMVLPFAYRARKTFTNFTIRAINAYLVIRRMKKRTSITLSPMLVEQAETLLKAEGFSSFSSLIEYLLRKRIDLDKEHAQDAKAA